MHRAETRAALDSLLLTRIGTLIRIKHAQFARIAFNFHQI